MLPSADLTRFDWDGPAFQALRKAGFSADEYDPACQDIENEIAWAARFYVSDVAFSVPPPEFRHDLLKFKAALEALVSAFPPRDSAVAEATRLSWEGQDEASRTDITGKYPDMVPNPWELGLHVDELERIIKPFVAITAELDEEERGRGRNGNRAANHFVDTLGSIFESATGRLPRRVYSNYDADPVAGPFGEFLRAVDDVLPSGFKFGDLDHLIRAYGAKSREKTE